MVFWKKKEPKPEIREIKEAVSAPPAPPLPKMELAPMPERPKFAPLFIKIERYQEVLRSIGSMKLVLASLRELLMLRKELERIKADSDSLLEKNIKEIEAVTGRLDAEFVRPKSAERPEFLGIERPAELAGVGEYVSDLQSELEKLESRLKGVE